MGLRDTFKYHKISTNDSSSKLQKESEPKITLPPLVHNACTLDRFSNYTNPKVGHLGSLAKHETFRRKHYRSKMDPVILYHSPIVESQKYGWYVTKINAPMSETLSWAHTPRFRYQSSEMTKFVETMTLTNKEFSLF